MKKSFSKPVWVICLFWLPLIAQGQAFRVEGKIIQGNEKTLLKAYSIDSGQSEKNVISTKVDSSGRFKIELATGQSYLLVAFREDYFAESKLFSTPPNAQEIVQLDPLKLYPLQEKQKIPLNGIYFRVESSKILPASYVELERLAQLLLNYPEMEIQLGIYTNLAGTVEQNLYLSQERAIQLKKYLISKGIKPNQVLIEGKGREYSFPGKGPANAHVDMWINKVH